MQLVIAEKPSVGVALAKALGVTDKKDGYIEGGGSTDSADVKINFHRIELID